VQAFDSPLALEPQARKEGLLRLWVGESATMKSKESKNGVKQNRKPGEQSERMSEYSAGGSESAKRTSS